MAPSPDPQKAGTKIQNEHDELLTLLQSIKRRLDGPAWQDAMLVSLLDSLREHLDAHFAYEESDDGFDHLVRRAPWLSGRIEALIADHRRLMGSACDLASRARDAERTAPIWGELQSHYAGLHDGMLAHESREHALFQEAYTQDIGDND